jgi:cell division protein FtsQ
VARVHVRRELPSTVVLDVVEREAACAVALDAIYLADSDGSVFKRATPDEAAVTPVVTGIAREDYLAQPAEARALIRQGLQALAAWRATLERPPVGEVHVDRIAGVTLYTDRGVGVRLGIVDGTLPERLRRFDAVAEALQAGHEEPRFIYVDNRARPDRVTVKLASAAVPAHSDNNRNRD